MRPVARRGRTMYQGARGAHVTTLHGPLERVVSGGMCLLGLKYHILKILKAVRTLNAITCGVVRRPAHMTHHHHMYSGQARLAHSDV